MYKQHLLLNIEREIVLLKQLTPFIEEENLTYRPAENMRSVHELMQYLVGVGYFMARWITLNDINDQVRAELKERRNTVSIANFNDLLDRQLGEIKAIIEKVSETDLLEKEVTLPTKDVMPMGAAMMHTLVKWLAAYRMQLFVYLKMNGQSTLATKEAWVVAQ